MKRLIIFLVGVIILIVIINGCTQQKIEETEEIDMDALADCLSSKGVLMYGSYTCSACRATRKMFGDSFEKITEIECNPHAPDTQADLCLEKEIAQTPAWILEVDGVDVKRKDGYQTAEELVEYFEC